jgi:hypothetical protein
VKENHAPANPLIISELILLKNSSVPQPCVWLLKLSEERERDVRGVADFARTLLSLSLSVSWPLSFSLDFLFLFNLS